MESQRATWRLKMKKEDKGDRSIHKLWANKLERSKHSLSVGIIHREFNTVFRPLRDEARRKRGTKRILEFRFHEDENIRNAFHREVLYDSWNCFPCSRTRGMNIISRKAPH